MPQQEVGGRHAGGAGGLCVADHGGRLAAHVVVDDALRVVGGVGGATGSIPACVGEVPAGRNFDSRGWSSSLTPNTQHPAGEIAASQTNVLHSRSAQDPLPRRAVAYAMLWLHQP